MSSETRYTGPRDIAIIGMSALFPKAQNIRQYWQNIIDKVDGISEGVPEWERGYYDPEMKRVARIYTKKGGFIDRDTRFDPLEFGIMPNTVDGTSPDQFLALKGCKEALVDSGYWDNPKWDKTRTGVILGYGSNVNRGNMVMFQHGIFVDQLMVIIKLLLPDIDDELLNEIRADVEAGLPKLRPEIVPGFVSNVLTGRISNRLDLMGPNYTVDAACSASFISLDAAMNELQNGRSDLMLAGGINCSMPAQMMMVFSIIEALTREDIRPFDKKASGVLLGEGAGVMVLKRLADAERDNDRIYAVIKGLSLASDGKSSGLLAPRLEGEILAMERTYEECGIDRDTITLIEAHGTGIPLGDSTEAQSMKAVFGNRPDDGLKLGLGAVKSMLGHSLLAAGAAGMIKTALSLHHKVLPPTLCDEVDPDLGFADSPIYVNNKTRPWIHGENHPRRAGVNAFGFGGIDGHCILEEYTGPSGRDTGGYKLMNKEWPNELFLFHGQTDEEVIGRVEDVIGVIQHPRQLLLRDIAYSLMKEAGGEFGPVRLAIIVGRDRDDAVKRLHDATDKIKSGKAKRLKGRGGIFYGNEVREGKLAMLYPGHGAQYPEMMSELSMCFPQVREWFDVFDQELLDLDGTRASKVVHPPPTVLTEEQREEQTKELLTGEFGIGLTIFTDYAMDELMRHTFGIKPDVMVGHSTGEISAIANSGYFNKPGKYSHTEPTRIIQETFTGFRDDLGGLPTGALLTVGAANREIVEQIIKDSNGKLAFVLDNCPNQVMLYGSEEDILEAKPKFEKAGGICERMPFDRAFHTPDFKGISDRLADKLDKSFFAVGDTKLFSATKGDYYPDDINVIQRWCTDLWHEPVMFRSAIERLYEDGVRFFIEVGTSSSLTGFVNDTLFGKDCVAVASDNMRKGDIEQIDTVLAQLYMNGRYPRFEGLYEHREVEQVPTRPGEVEEEKLSPTNKVLVRDVARVQISPEMLKKLDERFPNRGLQAIALATGQQIPDTVTPEPAAPTSPIVGENGLPQPEMAPAPVDSNAVAPSGQPQFDPYGNPLPDPNMMAPPQLDQWGNPLPPMPAAQPPMVDQWGNPLPQMPPQQFDASGNPIPPQQPMLDQWGNPLPPQPQFDQWGNPIPSQQWGPDFFGGGSPGVSPPPPPMMDAYGNPVDAWGNPLPLVDPYMAPPPPMMAPYGQPMPDSYTPPTQPVDAYPPPTAPAEMMPTEPAAPAVETVAPIVATPEPVAEPVPAVAEPTAPAVEATPEEVLDPKDLPYGQKPALTNEQMMDQLADPNTPDAPEHMVKRFDPELAVSSDHYPRPDLIDMPFERAYPWLGKVISQDENYLECDRHLSKDQDLVLKSHAFGGPPSRRQPELHAMTLVPFVMSMEICAEAACCLSGGRKYAKTFKNIRGHRWLALPQDTLDITIKAKKLKDLDGGDTLIRVEIFQQHVGKDGSSEPHLTFESMIIVGDKEHDAIPPMPFKVKDPRHSHFTDEMLYNDGILYNIHYPGRFHGRHFRAIKHIRHYSPQTVEVEMEAPDWDDLYAHIENPQFQFDQFLMDAAGVQVGLYYSDIFMMNPDLLPFNIRELKLFGGPPPPGTKIIGRAANRLSGVADIELATHPYLNHLDKEGNILFQIDENEEKDFDFPDNHYKSEMVPNLGCLDSFVDLLDAETGHVYVRAEGWQVRYFEIPRRLSKLTQYPMYYTLSEKWMTEETGYRMRINEPFITDVLTSSWGVWGSTLVHMVLTQAEKDQYYAFGDKNVTLREDWLMGRIVAKELLVNWIEENTTEGRLCPIDVEIRVDEHGKPFGVCVVNEDLTLPEISLARSKRYVVAVTSDGSVPIGVDYEWLDGFDPEDVLSGGFSPKNIERINELSDEDKKRATAALWCSKEAAAKALGTGLNHEPREWLVGSWDMGGGTATIQYKEERFHTRFWFTEAGEVVAVCERGSLSPSGDDDDSESDSTTPDMQTSAAEPVEVSSSKPTTELSSGSGEKATYATTEPFDSSDPSIEATEDEIDWDNPDREPTDLEYELIEMWEELLDLDDIGLHDDFFELGGESVLAVRLIGQVEKKMGSSIPVANFLKTRTVAQMARILSDEDWKPDWSSLVPMRVTGERTPLFFTHPVGGNVLKYRELISFIPEEQPLYALQARGLDGKEEAFNNVPEMAEYYLKGIRAAQKKGPYLLAGFSGGGVISWEMAYQLRQAGEEVALLALFDTFGPGYYSLEVGGSRLPHQLETFLWRIELHIENLKTLNTRQKIAYILRKIKHGNRKGRDGSGGTIRRVEDLTYEAVLSYKPKKLENVPVALLRASNQPKKSTRDPQLNWGPFVGESNLEVFEVYGTHGHLIEQPHVVGLAKTLNEVLDRTHAKLK